jgi:hypothetical protein
MRHHALILAPDAPQEFSVNFCSLQRETEKNDFCNKKLRAIEHKDGTQRWRQS